MQIILPCPHCLGKCRFQSYSDREVGIDLDVEYTGSECECDWSSEDNQKMDALALATARQRMNFMK